MLRERFVEHFFGQIITIYLKTRKNFYNITIIYRYRNKIIDTLQILYNLIYILNIITYFFHINYVIIRLCFSCIKSTVY